MAFLDLLWHVVVFLGVAFGTFAWHLFRVPHLLVAPDSGVELACRPENVKPSKSIAIIGTKFLPCVTE